MLKNEYFIDVSSYQTDTLVNEKQTSGTDKTIIKVSEGISWLSPKAQTQSDNSNPIGYYHFARFGGDSEQAKNEALFFINNLPNKKVPYLVCDYEDGASGDKQANTQAVLAFMRVVSEHGYKPIYYSYKPFTLANLDDYHNILNEFPESLWIAAYPDYQIRNEPVWDIFPSMDGIRWWQFTSNAMQGGLDKSVVLIDDDEPKEVNKENKENEEEEDMLNFVMRSKSGNQGYVGCVNGAVFGIGYWETVTALQDAGCKHLMIDDDDFNRLIDSQKLDDEKRNEVLRVALENVANTIKDK